MNIVAIADKFLLSGFKRGLSASSTLNILKAKGLGYRRTDMLTRFRELSGIPKKSEAIKYTPRRYRLNRKEFTSGLPTQRHRFKFIVDVTYEDRKTGKVFTEERSTVGNYNLTREQAEREVLNNINREPASVDVGIVVGVTLTAAYHRKGDIWF